MKNTHVLIFVAVAAVLVYFGYNYAETGTVSGGGTVAQSNSSGTYDELIDNLTSGLSANFGASS
jgi:hypothetical protein